MKTTMKYVKSRLHLKVNYNLIKQIVDHDNLDKLLNSMDKKMNNFNI